MRSLAASPETTLEAEERLRSLPAQVAEALQKRYGVILRRVLNATGIFLHTNLGRAPLPRAAVAKVGSALDAYCDLEYRLQDGKRGDRNERVNELLKAATGADAGILVNNNAGALVLVLAVLARGKQVVVSRGELVEIGGSFRVPDILEASGASLLEVGTTNRTRLSDYQQVLGEDIGAILKVYPSNYRQTGFISSVAPAELSQLGRMEGVPLVVDEGSGLLRPKPVPQLADHPAVQELIAAGCDLVCSSGDKLLGGPQAGVIVGTRELVDRCHRHPLYRALRPDRFTFAATEEILRHHLSGKPLPIDRLWVGRDELRIRLQGVAERIGAEIVAADAQLGGGSAPERPIPGEALALAGDERLLAALRSGDPPVIGYLNRGRLILDLRTVDPADDDQLVTAVTTATNRTQP